MHPIVKIVIQRLLLGILTLWVVSMIIFGMVALLPGNFAQSILGQSATPQAVANFSRRAGLDKPLVERYGEWLYGIAQGNFGLSYASFTSSQNYKITVASLVVPRLDNTLLLAGMVALIAVPLALALGLLAAMYQYSLYDRIVNLVTLTSISSPEFFLGYILMFLFAVRLGWFDSLATVQPGMSLGARLFHLVLPIATLVLVILAHMMRMTRAAIINLLASPYIEMARLKGMPRLRIILHHALPNAWAPIVNVIAVDLAYLVVGVVLVEVVFVYPGIGQLMVTSVSSRDIPVVQACALVFAAAYVLLNLLADIISIVTNPRILHPRGR